MVFNRPFTLISKVFRFLTEHLRPAPTTLNEIEFYFHVANAEIMENLSS